MMTLALFSQSIHTQPNAKAYSVKLLIPHYLTQRQQKIPAPSAPAFGVYYGLNEVAGRRASPADLVQNLAKYRRSDIIRWIAAVAGWFARTGGLEPGNQSRMAD